MKHQNSNRVCIVPHVSGLGGMVSFRHKLVVGLRARGINVTYDLSDIPYGAVLVIGGTRQLAELRRARQKGIPIVQRLDGMNWLHRLPVSPGGGRTGWRHYLRAEYGNIILRLIRSRLATQVVYQSQFVMGWWERVRGPTRVPNIVIYNGVDLDVYSPQGDHDRPDDRIRILMVEGSLMGGYEQGLAAGIGLLQRLGKIQDRQVELMVVGRVAHEVKHHWESVLYNNGLPSNILITWRGEVSREKIPQIDRSAHLLYSSDINAACPNAVIEALACGLPVVSFDTGALPELVRGDAGRVAPYGSDPWKLEQPDVAALVEAAAEILKDQDRFRAGARQHAEKSYSLDGMVDAYLKILLPG